MRICVLLLSSLTFILCASGGEEVRQLRDIIPLQQARDAFRNTKGTLVVVDCTTGEKVITDSGLGRKAFAPCSTFKIWNTLIGLEEGIIKDPAESFYKWDGQSRPIAEWNRDLTLADAFKVSCVPAFQNLARSIGTARMESWIKKLGYGNQDFAAGVDVFWLPKAGRTTILISPEEQAELIRRLLNGKIPVRGESVSTLCEIMKLESSLLGHLYGKTGSGVLNPSAVDHASSGDASLGWLVGFLRHQDRNYAYACIVIGPGQSGKEARHVVETVFKRHSML
jgi:beta-lactamase class D